ncbi:MAG: hypothetical protein WCO56_13355 [Verrucomicrobiota bacterium]
MSDSDTNIPPENLEPVRRLLALKRHEQPPPGFRADFVGKVMDRIRAGDNAEATPWLTRWWQTLVSRPALSAALAGGTCVLLIGGMVYSSSLKPDPKAQELALPSLNGTKLGPAFYNEFFTSNPELATNTSSATRAMPSLFAPISLPVERTSFQTN